MRYFRGWLALFSAVIGISWAVAQDAAAVCPALVESALRASETNCSVLGRNQVCYGHIQIDASPAADVPDFQFSSIGDVASLDAVQSMRLAAFNPVAGTWGIAFMRLQADLPTALPGQGVLMMAFGDTEVASATDQTAGLPATPNNLQGVNIRVAPSMNSPVLSIAAPGQRLRALGRSEDNNWLYMQLRNGTAGWAGASLFSFEGDMNALETIESTRRPLYGPMQAFYFNTTPGYVACNQMPASGLLIQTAAGTGSITVTANGVDVRLGSTLFFQAEPGREMSIAVLEGAARVEVGGELRLLAEGAVVRVPLNDHLLPAGSPSAVEPYEMSWLGQLPLNTLERDVMPAPPISEVALQRLQGRQMYFSAIEPHHFRHLLTYLDQNDDASDSEILGFLRQNYGYNYRLENGVLVEDFAQPRENQPIVRRLDNGEIAIAGSGGNVSSIPVSGGDASTAPSNDSGSAGAAAAPASVPAAILNPPAAHNPPPVVNNPPQNPGGGSPPFNGGGGDDDDDGGDGDDDD
ncbi:MAG: SH3 domain-containing protein [Blastochloris sp.]|nr:SH3 domain-containing protein [Blastochloris sp.]